MNKTSKHYFVCIVVILYLVTYAFFISSVLFTLPWYSEITLLKTVRYRLPHPLVLTSAPTFRVATYLEKSGNFFFFKVSELSGNFEKMVCEKYI